MSDLHLKLSIIFAPTKFAHLVQLIHDICDSNTAYLLPEPEIILPVPYPLLHVLTSIFIISILSMPSVLNFLTYLRASLKCLPLLSLPEVSLVYN